MYNQIASDIRGYQ